MRTGRWLRSATVLVLAAAAAVTLSAPAASAAGSNSPWVTLTNDNSNSLNCLIAASSTVVYPVACNESQVAQQWMFIYIGTGGPSDPRSFYQIQNRANGRCLAPATGGEPNAIVGLVACTSNWIDYWALTVEGNSGWYHVQNRPTLSGTPQQCMVSHGTATGSGNQPWLWNCNDFYDDQLWTFKIAGQDNIWIP